ncbi:AGRG2 protein, partial [Atractosteus spatula]|nr:AGRG2 protein [Atractosteus spatula]
MWQHRNGPLHLQSNLRRGCSELNITAGSSTLEISGEIMGHCENSRSISLPGVQAADMHFCVYWDGFLDLLQVEFSNINFTLCGPRGFQKDCCTGLSLASNIRSSSTFGISNGSIRGDVIELKRQAKYSFRGEQSDCVEDVCKEASRQDMKTLNRVDVIEETLMKANISGAVDLQCATAVVRKIEEDKGYNISIPAKRQAPSFKPPTIYIPPSLMASKSRKSAKVVCTYYNDFPLFQGTNKSKILNSEVVGITVENEVISDLRDPVIITFHHYEPVPTNMSRKCVFWDMMKVKEDTWNDFGCVTKEKSKEETECHCNHLTYFAVLLEINEGPVQHLVALTWVTFFGCAVTSISCVILIVLYARQRTSSSDTSALVHCNFTVALLLLNVLFLLNWPLATLENKSLCTFVAFIQHYSLLCSFTWMSIEAYNAFRLVYNVLNFYVKNYIPILCLVGYGLPLVVVLVLVSIPDVYGLHRIRSAENTETLMCWIMKPLVHYITNVSFFLVIFILNLAMLVYITNTIRKRGPWKENRIMLISVWGLTCLFGTTWGLAFLNFGALRVLAQIAFCIINSLQGFFLCVRYFLLRHTMRTRSLQDSTSGSVKQSMVSAPEPESAGE